MNKFLKLLATAGFIGLLSVSSTKALIDLSMIAAVIDVRTPKETASGYLEGALLFDVRGGNFRTQIGTLDKSANYIVYCHSGKRASSAIFFMKQAGFTGVLTNAGSISNATLLTGLKIIGAKQLAIRRAARLIGSGTAIKFKRRVG